MLAESIDQRAQRDTEELGGARLIAGALFECGDDPLALGGLVRIEIRIRAANGDSGAEDLIEVVVEVAGGS